MAINFTNLSSTPSTGSRDKVESQTLSQKNASTKQNATENAGQPSTVQLSDEALALQKLEEQVGKLPDVNADRVASIKASLEDGSYSVDAQRLAGNILSFENGLFN